MINGTVSSIANARYSWSTSGKDRNNDGKVTREEFKAPVAPGTTTIVPYDLRSGGSLDDAFDGLDGDGDGVIKENEAPRPDWANHLGRPTDRYHFGWNLNKSQDEINKYMTKVEKDNIALVEEWGLKI